MDVAVSVCCGWTVAVLACLKWMSPLWFVAVSVCRRSGLSPFQLVAVSTIAVSVRLKWMSPLWFVAVSVCRHFSLSPF